MVFSWLKGRRRRLIREAPFSTSWDSVLRRNVRHVGFLDGQAREQLRAFVSVFLAEKRFEGCRGMLIDDEVRVTVAGMVGVTMLGFDDELFDHVRTLLIYPGDYRAPKSKPLAGGAVLEWEESRLGETWSSGSMVLSWPRVLEGTQLRRRSSNLLVHEWAHAYDMQSGEADGVPPMPAARRSPYAALLGYCYDRFLADLDDDVVRSRVSPLDDYAAESTAEFFAVASECFFQNPHRLARYDTDLFGLLVEVWRQDPCRYMPRAAG
jgi:Mlc titration factor MtfA (ptsG expression regulator)